MEDVREFLLAFLIVVMLAGLIAMIIVHFWDKRKRIVSIMAEDKRLRKFFDDEDYCEW